MWKLAEPGKGAAEGCLLRLQQQEFYEEGYGDGAQLQYYPDVSVMTWAVIGAQFDTVERYIERCSIGRWNSWRRVWNPHHWCPNVSSIPSSTFSFQRRCNLSGHRTTYRPNPARWTLYLSQWPPEEGNTDRKGPSSCSYCLYWPRCSISWRRRGSGCLSSEGPDCCLKSPLGKIWPDINREALGVYNT